jgi:hypothetical protein
MTPSVQSVFSFARPVDDAVEVIMRRLPTRADLLTVQDIAVAMEIGESTARGFLEDGSLPFIACGNGEAREFRKISRNTFKQFLELRTSGVL